MRGAAQANYTTYMSFADWQLRVLLGVAAVQAVAVCAGAAHTCVLTCTGVVLCWRSADPAVMVQEVGGALAGRRVVSISAGRQGGGTPACIGHARVQAGRSGPYAHAHAATYTTHEKHKRCAAAQQLGAAGFGPLCILVVQRHRCNVVASCWSECFSPKARRSVLRLGVENL